MRALRTAILVAVTALSGAAFAKGTTPPPQTHHCKMPDGTMDMKKTHKQCTAAKGSWVKDESAATGKDTTGKDTTGMPAKDHPATGAPATPTPAPAPAPAPGK